MNVFNCKHSFCILVLLQFSVMLFCSGCFENTGETDPGREIGPGTQPPGETTPPNLGVVDLRNKIFRENIDIAGTPFQLSYSSWRVPGNRSPYTLNVPVYDPESMSDYTDIQMTVSITNRSYEYSVSKPFTSHFFIVQWDGTNATGQVVPGVHRAKMDFVYKRIVYVMEGQTDATVDHMIGADDGGGGEGFSSPLIGPSSDVLILPPGGGYGSGRDAYPQSNVSGSGGGSSGFSVPSPIPPMTPKEFTERQTRYANVGVVLANVQALGGWTISSHHHYDRKSQTLYFGNGTFTEQPAVGTPTCVFASLGQSASESNLYSVVSRDGDELFVFNADGYHLMTLNVLTGITNLLFGYDAEERLETITDRFGNETTIERLVDGTPTAIISPYSQRTDLTLDSSGFIKEIINPEAETNRFYYASGGLLTNVITRMGHTYTIHYDNVGRVTRADYPTDLYEEYVSTNTYTAYRDDYVIGGVRTNAYITEYLESSMIRRETRGPNCCQTNTETMSKDGLVSTIVRADGTTIEIEREPHSQFGLQVPLVKEQVIQLPSGLAKTVSVNRVLSYYATNDPLSIIAITNEIVVNGKTSIVDYVASAKRMRYQSPEGRMLTYEFDNKGFPTNISIPGVHSIRLARDAQGRAIEVAQGSGGFERRLSYHYDSNGNLRRITNALGQEIQVLMDRIGRVTNVIRPDSEQIAISYNKGANITGITPPGKPKHGFSYNEINYSVAYSAPHIGGSTNIVYSWNTLRDLTGVTFPDGRSITNLYLVSGELIESRWPENKITNRYDVSSRRLLGVYSTNGHSFALTWNGPLLTAISAGGSVTGSVAYGYDANFRATSVVFNGTGYAYRYDKDSLLTNAGSLVLRRDPQTGIRTNMALGAITESQQFNMFGEMATQLVRFSASELYGVNYHYDALGRITSRVEKIQGVTQVWAYAYDLAGRLFEVYTNGSLRSRYQYDANGNRTNALVFGVAASAQYDNQDRLLTNDAVRYQYNDHGTLTNMISGAETNCYVYDARGSLLEVRYGANVIRYTVDPLGRRTAREKNGVITQRFVYQDFLKPIAIVNSDGSTDSRFIYATRVNVPDYMVRSGITYRIIIDHLGSVRLVVNPVTGSVAQRMDYDEWGRVLQDTNPGFQPFGYAGGLYDPDTGLVRFGFRDYDPRVGRWLAKDPILFAGRQANLYLYCHGDPVNRIDPWGLGEQSYWNDITSLFTWDNVMVSLEAELTLGAGGTISADKDVGGDQNGFNHDPTYGLSVGAGATFSLSSPNNSGFTETWNVGPFSVTFDESTGNIVGIGVSVGPGITIISKTKSRMGAP